MFVLINDESGEILYMSKDRGILEEIMMDEFMDDFQGTAQIDYEDWIENYAYHEDISIPEAVKLIEKIWNGSYPNLARTAWEETLKWYNCFIIILEIPII